jgi:hypothetical protein
VEDGRELGREGSWEERHGDGVGLLNCVVVVENLEVDDCDEAY